MSSYMDFIDRSRLIEGNKGDGKSLKEMRMMEGHLQGPPLLSKLPSTPTNLILRSPIL